MTARHIAALILLSAAAALGPGAPAFGAPPIPQDQAELAGLDLFSGRVARPRPVSAPRVPRHPFMAANGRSNVHNDAYQTDTYRNSGPLGRRTRAVLPVLRRPGRSGLVRHHDRLRSPRPAGHHLRDRRRGLPAHDGPPDPRHDRPAPATGPGDPSRPHPVRGRRRRLLLPRPSRPSRGLRGPEDLHRGAAQRLVAAGEDVRSQRAARRGRPAQLRAARLVGPAVVRLPQGRSGGGARPAQRPSAGHPPHRGGHRQLVRGGRQRRGLRGHRPGSVPLRRGPSRAAEDQLAVAV